MCSASHLPGLCSGIHQLPQLRGLEGSTAQMDTMNGDDSNYKYTYHLYISCTYYLSIYLYIYIDESKYDQVDEWII